MRILFGAAAIAAAVAMSMAGAASAKTFRYAFQGDVLGLDPHTNNHGTTNALKGMTYEALLHRKPDLSLEPSLATEWTQVNPTTWRFKLRQNVKFHNGNPFTADDVVFSFKRVNHPQSEMAYTVLSIASITKVNSHEVEIVTKGPNPTLLQELPLFFIMDEEWTVANNATEVVRGAAVQNFPNTNSNGTGPFMIAERVPDTRTVFVPNPNWWGKPEHNLTRAVFTPIANAATRVAALLSGELDMMYDVPLQDVQRMSSAPGVKVLQGPELRTIFLGFDQWRDELLDMPGTGKNPFKDVRVRRAFYQAIDINAIQRVVMRGASTPTGLMIAPGIQGFDPKLNDRYPFDPDGAKKLLTEAGYPNGFPVTLDCPNNRYVNDEAICQAIVPMIKRIGVDIRLNAQPLQKHFDKISKKENNNTSFYMLGWTPGSYDAHNVLIEILTDNPGTWNSGRYNNPRVKELAGLIAVETNMDKRNAMISEAMKIHKEEFGHIPLHQQALAWAVRDTVDYIWQRPFNDVDLRYVRMK
ncbi:MAG: ABC transporter substrate-binding protein [Thalassobaculales bacterium]